MIDVYNSSLEILKMSILYFYTFTLYIPVKFTVFMWIVRTGSQCYNPAREGKRETKHKQPDGKDWQFKCIYLVIVDK